MVTSEIRKTLQENERPHTGSVDPTGRDRIAWNALSSWGAYVVFVIAGFIMPRFIDRHMGQSALGVWDFGWSLVSYLTLTPLGIGSAVNRYVAKYRSTNDPDGLRRTVSSVMFVQLIAAAVAFGLTMALTWAVPFFLSGQLGLFTHEARWVVFLLGLSICLQISSDMFRGVITGCHRWDLHNGITSGSYALIVGAMMAALSLGGGLRTLALANLGGVVLAEVARAALAFHVCPELRVRWAYVSREDIRGMLGFGFKSIVLHSSPLLLYQSSSILVVAYLGPAALAVYSRPMALVRHVNTIVSKYAYVLVPTASGLQATGRAEELRDLLTQSGRFGAYLALPMVLGLTVMGDPILRVWMGPAYEQGLVLAILAVGHLLPITQEPVINILTGLNLHGRVGLMSLIAAISAVGLGVFTIGHLHWGLLGATLSVTLPLVIARGVYVPLHACGQLGLPLRQYVTRVFRGPVLCAIPYALCLLTARILFSDKPLAALGWGFTGGAAILVPLYWRYLLPGRFRESVIRLARRTLQRYSPRGAPPQSTDPRTPIVDPQDNDTAHPPPCHEEG